MTAKHFERHGRGVYHCDICRRATRRTTQALDSMLCAECWDLAGIENSVLDGAVTVGEAAEERDRLVTRAIEHGGDALAIRDAFADLWGE